MPAVLMNHLSAAYDATLLARQRGLGYHDPTCPAGIDEFYSRGSNEARA